MDGQLLQMSLAIRREWDGSRGSLESVEGQTDHDWAAHGRIRTNLPKMDMKDEGFPRR